MCYQIEPTKILHVKCDEKLRKLPVEKGNHIIITFNTSTMFDEFIVLDFWFFKY